MQEKLNFFYENLHHSSLNSGDSGYPDRESNSELSFRRALLYPFNYQGSKFFVLCECKGTKKREKGKVKSEKFAAALFFLYLCSIKS